MVQNARTALLCLTLLLPATAALAAPAPVGILEVTPARVRAQPGERLEFRILGEARDPRALFLPPGGGAQPLNISSRGSAEYRLTVTVPSNGPAGLHLIHVWTGDRRQPSAVGKAAVLAGPLVLDFFLPRYLDVADPERDVAAYLDDFRSLGGNTLIAHALITPEQAYFPSAIARTTIRRGSRADAVEHLLTEADRRGLAVFLSVSWDMTRVTPYRDRMRQITALMDEMFSLYAGHASLAGFYSYQEGSGTYYVPYIREFTGHVKSLNPGLLSACAPFVDDPLVAGYLSTVDTLDVTIFQGQVMGSYRTDNRKRYPLRRVRDFASLGIGAKWLQDKIAITHVELFGYLENRPDPNVIAASYANIFGQIASVATAPGADGIALFAYHPHIWSARRHPRVQRSRQAVADGLDLFMRLQRLVGPARNPLAVYFPYSDWIVERWATGFLPALDAFRRVGVPVDIVPYAPPFDESEYPYFPFHMNRNAFERLASEQRILILPDVSGFQQTDSDLIDAFVRGGGVIVAFGPQIPMGRSFDRDRLFGARESEREAARQLRVPRAFGRRTAAGKSCALPPGTHRSWTATTASVWAVFGDGSPAVLANRYGEGLAVVVLPSAADLAAGCGDVMRDVLERSLTEAGQRALADIGGLNEATDVAIAPTSSGLVAAIVNHAPAARDATLRALHDRGRWFDAVTGRQLEALPDGGLRLAIPSGGVRIVDLRRDVERQP
jgi:hypothetical protein